MAVLHMSEVLKEFYLSRAREDLDSIEVNGLLDVLDSGAEDELIFLMQVGALDSYDIGKAQERYLTATLWTN